MKQNVKWEQRKLKTTRTICQKYYKSSTIAASSHNNEPCISYYQQGGTLTIVNDHLTRFIKKQITNPSSLGRWSGFTLSTTFSHNVHVITVYQPTKSPGVSRSYQQQIHFHKTKGITNPNPRAIFLQDLTKLIKTFNTNGDKTTVLKDANDNLFNKSSSLPSFPSDKAMTTLIKNPLYHPATHMRGTKFIYYIFGTESLLPGVVQSGICPFLSPTC
jgi:hypothetical protein